MIQSERKTIRVLIADDHLIMREGLRFILEGHADFACLGAAADGASTVRLAGELQPDVVLLDMHISDIDGVRVIAHLRHMWPNMAVVILTNHHNDEILLSGLRAGASGYLLKNINRETLFHAIRTAARGETLLQPELLRSLLAHNEALVATRSAFVPRTDVMTGREREVLLGVARGERNKEIAARLGISEPTVKSHLVSVYAKLGVDSRASAVATAIERGLISFPNRPPGNLRVQA